MQRRTFLAVGLSTAIALSATGGLALMLRERPWSGSRLTTAGRDIFAALARAILDGTLSEDEPVARRQLAAHLERVDAAIRQFPPSLQAELSQLLALLDTAPGRRWLFTLDHPWHEARPDDVQHALARLRASDLELRRQTYHALRDLTNAAYYSEPGTWAALGYPGPTPI